MAQLRAPGVYYDPGDQRVPTLTLGRTGLPVFLGITRRGPLDRPVRITSLDRYEEIFGEPLPHGYLHPALAGYFDNGGDACFVLRLARERGLAGQEVAQASGLTVVDGVGQPALRVEAQDPGTWGNELRLTVRSSAEVAHTLLTRDAHAGDQVVAVKSTYGLTPGTLMHIEDQSGGGIEQVEIVRVARHVGELSWDARQALAGRFEGLSGRFLELSAPLSQDFKSNAPTWLTPRAFDVIISSPDTEEVFERLSLSAASPRFVDRIINEQSRLVRVGVIRSGTPLAHVLPIPVRKVGLRGGQDGLDDLGAEEFIGEDRGPGLRRGLHALLDRPEIDVVAVPDLMLLLDADPRRREARLREIEAVQEAVVRHCEHVGNRFAILEPPPAEGFEDTLRWRQKFDTAHAAFYFPWVVVLEGGRRRAVPPSGHVAGIIARTDREVGVHKAPANEVLSGVVDLDILLQDQHLALLNHEGINCLRAFASRGIRIWGARTASSEPEWRYVNVRRTISAIQAAIDRGCQWAVFEPNGVPLWKSLSRMIVNFLADLRERGILMGAQSEDAFYVKCDAETNPPENIERGMLVTEIGLAVSRPVEFIIFRLVQRLEDPAQQQEET